MDHTCRAVTKAIRGKEEKKAQIEQGTAWVSSSTEKGLAKLKESGAGNGLVGA